MRSKEGLSSQRKAFWERNLDADIGIHSSGKGHMSVSPIVTASRTFCLRVLLMHFTENNMKNHTNLLI